MITTFELGKYYTLDLKGITEYLDQEIAWMIGEKEFYGDGSRSFEVRRFRTEDNSKVSLKNYKGEIFDGYYDNDTLYYFNETGKPYIQEEMEI